MTIVRRHADPAAFWNAARACLEADEAANTHLLAIASRHAVEPGATPPIGYVAEDHEGIRAAAMLTAKGSLFTTRAPTDTLAPLVAAARAEDIAINDVIGERQAAEAAARLAGGRFRVHVGLQLYRLDAVDVVPDAPGAMRLAGERDFALLCAWQSAFLDEIAARETAEEVPQLVRRRLNLGGAWIWEAGGEPVAHAGHRPTPVRSARIAPVYTPPGHRGRGYATALVATLARHLLDQGHRPLYLFADTLNPTSNGIYRRVGFQPAGDHLHLTRVGGA